MLFHAALVGTAAGLAGAAFSAGAEYLQRFLLEKLAGYIMLRAHGETFASRHAPAVFRPWLLMTHGRPLVSFELRTPPERCCAM
jgi:hypothetical protein